MGHYVRISSRVLREIEEIHAWTEDRLGVEQAERYSELIERAIVLLKSGDHDVLLRRRADLPDDARIYSISHAGGRASHVFLLRLLPSGIMELDAVLHEAMDLRRHLPDHYKK